MRITILIKKGSRDNRALRSTKHRKSNIFKDINYLRG